MAAVGDNNLYHNVSNNFSTLNINRRNQKRKMASLSTDGMSVGSSQAFNIPLSMEDFDDVPASQKRQRINGDYVQFNFVDRMLPMVGHDPFASNEVFTHNLATELFEEPVSLSNIYLLANHHKEKGNTMELHKVQAYQSHIERVKNNYVQYACADQSFLRVYPLANASIGQSFSRLERSVLACDIPRSTPNDIVYKWKDIDMVNAAPVLIQNLYHLNNIPCETLDFYCSNRDALFTMAGESDVPISRKAVKKLFCAAMNGARVFLNTPRQGLYGMQFNGRMVKEFDLRSKADKRENNARELIIKTDSMPTRFANVLRKFSVEMHDNALRLLSLYERHGLQDFVVNTLKISDTMNNKLGCFTARMFNLLERAVLTVAIDYCISERVIQSRAMGKPQVCLIHDGFMVRSDLIDFNLCFELQQEVQSKLGIDIEFDIKDFDDELVISILEKKEEVEEIMAATRGKTTFDNYKTEEDCTIDWDLIENFPHADRQAQETFAIAEMNKHFAVIERSDPPFILTKVWKSPYHKKTKYCEQILMSQSNFRTAHSNRYIFVRERLKKDGTWRMKRVLLTDLFLQHRHRLWFDDVTFVPTQTSLSNLKMHNLFTGFAIEPWRAERFVMEAIANEGSTLSPEAYVLEKIQPFIELLRDHVVGEHYEYVINWAAHVIQPATRAVKTCKRIDLFSKRQGTGKGIFVDHFLGAIIGPAHYLKVTDLKMLENFNSLIQKACLIFADEAYFTGDHGAASKLKNIVSEYDLLYNKKNVNQWVGTNYANVITANNISEAHPRTEIWSRRVTAFNCPSTFGGQPTEESDSFFVDQCLALDVHFVAYYLYNKDLSEFSPRKGPVTKRLIDQIRASFPKAVRYIFNLLLNEKLPYKAIVFDGDDRKHSLLYDEWTDNGLFLPHAPCWKENSIVLHSQELFENFRKNTRNNYTEHVQFCQTLREVLGNVHGFARIKKRVRGKEERCYRLPSLVECQKSFCEYTANGSNVVSWNQWISEGYNSVHFEC